MTDTSKIAKNTVYLSSALIIQKIIAYIFFLVIASKLGTEGTGEYVAAFSFTGLFSVLVDVGLSNVLVREVAKQPELAEKYFKNTVGLKLVFGLVAYLLLLMTIVILDLVGATHPSLAVVAVAGLVMFLDSMVLVGSSVFRGWQLLQYESIIVVVQKIGVFIAGILVLFLYPSALNLTLAIVIGGVFAYGLLTKFLSTKINKPWWPNFDWVTQKALLRMSFPFALASLFAMGYSYIDSILLSVVHGNSAVGLYSVASKTMNAFIFIPSAFMAAVYPAMSEAYVLDRSKLQDLTYLSLRYLAMIGLPVAVGIFILAKPFVLLIGKEYADSVVAVQILLPSLIFMFLTYPLGSFLNATSRQHWQTAILGFGLVSNIILNILLIPRYSFLGASVAWSITNVLMLLLGLYLSNKVVNILTKKLFISFFKLFLSVIMMSVVVYLTMGMPVYISVISGAAVYLIGLVITKELTTQDYLNASSIIRYGK